MSARWTGPAPCWDQATGCWNWAAEPEQEALTPDAAQFNAVLGFNYLHLVRDLPGTLRRIHALLAAEGLFISKTPCVGDMNPLIRFALLPAMRTIGKAPYAGVFGRRT